MNVSHKTKPNPSYQRNSAFQLTGSQQPERCSGETGISYVRGFPRLTSSALFLKHSTDNMPEQNGANVNKRLRDPENRIFLREA